VSSIVEARLREASATAARVIVHTDYVRLELVDGQRSVTRIVLWGTIRESRINPLTEMVRRMTEELADA
jgi:hypothetical protein